MLESQLLELRQRQMIGRKPEGRMCRVEHVDHEKKKVLVKDLHISAGPFWVNFSTLLKKWRVPPGKE